MPTAAGEGRFTVEIDETILAPLRAAFGDDQNRLFLLGWRHFGISVDASIRLNRQLPVGFFSSSWELFHQEFGNPAMYGDGPDGRDQLEVVLLIGFVGFVPILKPGTKWLAIDHQAGGLALYPPQVCRHPSDASARGLSGIARNCA